MIRSLFAATLTVLVVTISASNVHAQRPSVRRFQPRRQTFSPYMDYFRRDVGLLDQYNYFRQRDQRLQQTFGQQQGQIDLQRQGLQQVGQEFGQLGDTLQRFRPTGATPTGKRATFQTFARFFNTRSSRR